MNAPELLETSARFQQSGETSHGNGYVNKAKGLWIFLLTKLQVQNTQTGCRNRVLITKTDESVESESINN